MSAIFAFITQNWVAITACVSLLQHIFPAKTVAAKISRAIVASGTPTQALENTVNTFTTPNGSNK